MKMDATFIRIGCHVELNLVDRTGKKNPLAVDIVEDEAADYAGGFLGSSTPLAKVLLGEKAGTVIPYLRDDIFALEIVSVTPSSVSPPTDAQRKRQERLDDARREVEHTNAVVFASSFSGKWGDYDTESLPKDDKPDEEEAGKQRKAGSES